MSNSRRVVFAGLATTLVVTVANLLVAATTGSSAMLAEGLHSVIDTGNSLLLALGLRRSRRPAHARHPFGHGKEIYFWSFIVAVKVRKAS